MQFSVGNICLCMVNENYDHLCNCISFCVCSNHSSVSFQEFMVAYNDEFGVGKELGECKFDNATLGAVRWRLGISFSDSASNQNWEG